MRRKWKPEAGTRIPFDPDIRKQLDPEQLQNFAACCLTWNRIENALSVGFAFCLGLPPRMRLSVSSRMSGIEAKYDVVKDSLKKHILLDEKTYATCADTLGTLMTYKRYRDGIVHAYIHDPMKATAVTTPKKGEFFEALITKDALEAFYQGLMAIFDEMSWVVEMIKQTEPLARRGKPDDRVKIATIAELYMGEVSRLQKARKALAPLPEFV
jgi:hypothetical protein